MNANDHAHVITTLGPTDLPGARQHASIGGADVAAAAWEARRFSWEQHIEELARKNERLRAQAEARRRAAEEAAHRFQKPAPPTFDDLRLHASCVSQMAVFYDPAAFKITGDIA